MADTDGWIAGRFHDDVDVVSDRLGTVGNEMGRSDPGLVPAHALARVPRALRIEIDDDGYLEPGYMRHLRQEHRAELAGADQRHAHRLAGGVAGLQEGEEVHGKAIQ